MSAQILPDATLPTDSTVNLEGEIQHITGGTTAGSNLHSTVSASLMSVWGILNSVPSLKLEIGCNIRTAR
ncbi:MAG: hypothetical protein SWY16_07170 [Cyanobacteriota bacterium]|nr:hypothetical protein [Cyanobacteriota bacterium]